MNNMVSNNNNDNKSLCFIKSWSSPESFLKEMGQYGINTLVKNTSKDGVIFATYGVKRTDAEGATNGWQVAMTVKTEWSPEMQINLVCRLNSGLERKTFSEKKAVFAELAKQNFQTVGQKVYSEDGEELPNYFFLITKKSGYTPKVGDVFTANGVATAEEIASLF